MSRSSFFKFALIASLAVICVMLVTRNRISETSQLTNSKSQLPFDDTVQAIVNTAIAESESTLVEENEEQLRQLEEVENEHAQDGGGEQADEEEPPDDSHPGAYLKSNQPAPTNQSHCKYNYNLPYDLVYTIKNYLFPPEQGNTSLYRIIYNVTEAYNLVEVPQITYATHMTANFAYFIPELLKHWDGLVTVAAFVPDLDVAFFLEQINQFCYCEPQMHRVSIHIVTHEMLPFSKKDIYFDRPQDCVPQDSSAVPIFSDYDQTVIYPINVVRNAARTSALTKYVLLSDSELIPSKGLAKGFLQMVAGLNRTTSKEVFHVPIFEVAAGTAVPEDKPSLVRLIQNKLAMYFHQSTCEHCQKFPNIDQWLSCGSSNEVKPFETVKRHAPFHRWEPIFIGTNQEPLYSEQLSWEGLQDKMTQLLEMCLQDYSFTVLDNAFLCHWPGIKTAQNEDWRVSFIEENTKNYASIVKELLRQYKDIPACEVRFVAVK